MKRCPVCGRNKSYKEWPRNAARPDGLSSRCKDCRSAEDRRSIFTRTCGICLVIMGQVRKDQRYCGMRCATVARRLKKVYGLTPRAYRRLVGAAHGRCAVCKSTDRQLHIDHDHRTGRVRGLLCISCNVLVGHLEKPEQAVVAKAIDYIVAHDGAQAPRRALYLIRKSG